jgi:general secretion pathway protein D
MRKTMDIKIRNTNKPNQRVLLNSSLFLICLCCAILAGCESESNTMTVQPKQELIAQINERMHPKGFDAKQIEQPDTVLINPAGKKELRQVISLPKPEAAINNNRPSEYKSNIAPAVSNTIPPANKTQVHSPTEFPPTSGKIITTKEQPSSETAVKLPALDKPGMADELICVNFDEVDIRMVLKTVGDITGINFVVDDSVRGSVTVMFPTKIRLGDVYKVLESILEVKGYAAVPAGKNLVKIVPRAEAAKRNLQVRFGSNPSEIPRNDSIVTQIIPLNYANVADVSQVIQPLLATGAQMATYPRTNSIVITDTSSNIHHIAKIIQNLDVKEQITVFSLNYASAQIISEQIISIIQKSRITSSQVGRSRSISQSEAGIKILPDIRTNSLVVVANTQDTETIERLIRQLDVQRPTGTNNVHVVYLENAQAKEVAESLTAALGNLRITGALEATLQVQVTADEGTNALIIAASAQDFEVIYEIIEKLDIVREQVLVEMFIMEISEDGLKEIGIDWATLDQAVEDSVRFFGATSFGPRVDFASGNLEGLAVGAWRGSGTDIRIGSVLHALEKQSGVNILSTPHITTSNHSKAKIIVGENRPFVMESRITETDPMTPTVIKTYEYKDVGISLEITPHISQGGLVRLEIDSEFSKLVEGVTSSSTDTPTTAKRKAQTVVSMKSGSTIVIGGLIRDDKTTIEKKIPLIGDLPLVGGLFRLQKDQLQKTNLLIFITPYVISSQKDFERITEKKKKEMEPAIEELGKNSR